MGLEPQYFARPRGASLRPVVSNLVVRNPTSPPVRLPRAPLMGTRG